MHETFDFISRDENVTEHFAQKPAGCIAKPGRNRNDWTPDANDASELLNELAVGVGLWANRIDDAVRAVGSLGDREDRRDHSAGAGGTQPAGIQALRRVRALPAGERWSVELPALRRHWQPYLESTSAEVGARRAALEALAGELLTKRGRSK